MILRKAIFPMSNLLGVDKVETSKKSVTPILKQQTLNDDKRLSIPTDTFHSFRNDDDEYESNFYSLIFLSNN